MTIHGDWYVIRTNPQSENKAAGELRRAGVRVYLPKRTFSSRNRRTGIVSTKTKPLLIGYLFIRFPGVEPNWFAVRKCQGVRDVLRWFNDEFGWWEPLSIPQLIVAAYMRRQRKREFDDIVQKRRMRKATYRKGQKMQVVDGPFASFMAVIEKLHKNGVVEADVKIFGRETRVSFEFPEEMLKPVARQDEAA